MTRRPIPSRRALAALLPLSMAVAACGGGDASADAGASGLDAPDRTLEVSPEPVYRVGGFDAPEWATFGSISRLAFDDRGHLFVLDDQTNTVTEIDAQGEFVRTVGRPGEGPGEFSTPFGMALTPEGGVAVFDMGHRGWVVYDAAGEFLRNVQVDMGEIGLPGNDLSNHPAGGVVGSVGGRIRMGPPSAAASEPEAPSRPVTFFSFSEEDASRVVYSAWDMPEAPEGEQQNLTTSGGGAIQLRMPVLRAFEPGLSTGVLPDGRIAVVDSVGYRVKLVDMEGTVVDVLERPIAPTPVTGGIQERERQRRLDEMAAGEGPQMMVRVMGGGGGATVDRGGVSEMMRSRVESMIFAEVIPVIERIAVDREGRIWVQRSSGEPGEPGPTDLLTGDGRYLGSLPPDGVRIPRAFGPDGLMVRVEEDEFDVPTLVVERMPADVR